MNSFEILNSDNKIFGNHFLEASAGTGKTFTIQHLVVRLILESNPALSLKDILVVTFTKAATRELRSRIRNTLEKTCEDLKNRTGEPYLQKIISLGEESIKEAKRRLKEALVLFDEASIYTIHGFCFRMLQECAFEMNMPLRMEDPENNNLDEIAQNCILDVLRFKLSPSYLHPLQFKHLLGESQGKIESLVRTLQRLILDEAEILSLPSFEEDSKDFAQAVFKAKKKINSLADFQESLNQMIDAHKLGKITKAEAKEQNKVLFSILGKSVIAEELAELIKEKTLFLEFLVQENLSSRAKILWSKNDEETLSFLKMLILPIHKRAVSAAYVLLKIAKLCKQDFETELQKKELLSFFSLLKRMQLALRNPAAVKKISTLYKAVVVDEFQDTDPLQWEIFHKLFFTGATKAFYLVGDPKQSIYGFRSADVYTYLKALESFGPQALSFLDTCYRSSPSLIQALNVFFSSWPWMQLPEENKSLNYHPVKPRENFSEATLNHPLYFALFIDDDSKKEKLPSVVLEEEKLFPFVEKQIKILRIEKGLKLNEFAILVKDRYQAERVRQYLKVKELTAVIKRTSSLLETLGFELIHQFLHALSHPRKLGVIKSFLASAWFNYSHTDLIGSLENPLLFYSIEKIAELHALFYKKGFAASLELFLETLWYNESSSVLSKLLSFYPLEIYGQLQQLLEVMVAHENEKGSCPIRMYNFLKQLKAQNSHDEKLHVIQHVAEDAITIMTTHLSKGLEFEIVFAIGIACRTPLYEGYSAVRIDNKKTLVPFEGDNIYCLKAIEEADAEKLRQLYVALTRAKSRVYIPLIIDAKSSDIAFGSASPMELFLAQIEDKKLSLQERYTAVKSLNEEKIVRIIDEWKKDADVFLEKIETLEIPDFEPIDLDTPIISRKETPFIPKCRETILSFSSLKHKAEDSLAIFADHLEEEEKEEEIADKLPAGAEFGSLFHSIMEEIFTSHFYCPFDKEKIYETIHHFVRKGHFSTYTDKIYELIEKTLHMELSTGEDSFTLLDIEPEKIFIEMEFLFPESECFVKGFADLIFERKGKYFILDWKSNDLKDYSEKCLKEEMVKHNYFLQASIYAEALARYLTLFDKLLFQTRFGGAFYIFVRHPAYLHFIPQRPANIHQPLAENHL